MLCAGEGQREGIKAGELIHQRSQSDGGRAFVLRDSRQYFVKTSSGKWKHGRPAACLFGGEGESREGEGERKGEGREREGGR